MTPRMLPRARRGRRRERRRPWPAERRTLDAATRARFFDCTLVWTAQELAGDEPYVIYEDADSDPFFCALVLACRGEEGFRGVVRDADDAASREGLVFMEGPLWPRSFEAFHAAGVHGARVRVVLYFENDPSGLWDFAKACGGSLAPILEAGGLPADRASALSDYLERWVGGRVAGGRLLASPGYYARDFRARLEAGGAAIARVLAALADDESRAAYARILFGAPEQVLSAFAKRVFGPQQYMDIVCIRPGDVIVNCGVSNGWELPYFLSRLRGQGFVHNFDPTMCYEGTVYGEYIDLFADRISDHRIVLGEVDGELLLPVAYSDMVRSGPAAPGEEARLEAFPCRRLDSLAAEGLFARIDHIKMDVEGGELAILRGAIESIRAHRPTLSVAIYHEPEHFWEYPGYLLDALEDYRFYVRQYGYSRFETLLYAVPMEDDASGSGEERLPGAPRKATAERRREEPVLFYFRDRPGAAREVFTGPQRAAARFFGAAWETADMRPAPLIENDELVGVFEQERGAVLVTKHAYEPQNVQLVIGETRDGLGVVWTVATGVAPDAWCAIVESDDGGVRVLAYEAAGNAARLFLYDGGALSPELDFAPGGRPLAGRFGESGALELDVLSEDGLTISRRTYSERGLIRDGPSVPVGADPIVATALIKSYRPAGAVYRRAYLASSEDGERLIVLERSGDDMVAVRSIPWDRRFEPARGLVAQSALTRNR